MKKIILRVIGFAAAVAVLFVGGGCNDIGVKNAGENGGQADDYLGMFMGTFTDKRDGTVYRKVNIGGQTWMAENLNYDTLDGKGSWCYDNDTSYCSKYGRLYDWATAMGINTLYNDSTWDSTDVNHRGICPSGWHLPSEEEWVELINLIGTMSGTALKAETGWADGNGNDDYKFSALPGGKLIDGFQDAGKNGFWWTTTQGMNTRSNDYASNIVISHTPIVNHDTYEKKINGYSLRCLQDT